MKPSSTTEFVYQTSQFITALNPFEDITTPSWRHECSTGRTIPWHGPPRIWVVSIFSFVGRLLRTPKAGLAMARPPNPPLREAHSRATGSMQAAARLTTASIITSAPTVSKTTRLPYARRFIPPLAAMPCHSEIECLRPSDSHTPRRPVEYRRRYPR